MWLWNNWSIDYCLCRKNAHPSSHNTQKKLSSFEAFPTGKHISSTQHIVTELPSMLFPFPELMKSYRLAIDLYSRCNWQDFNSKTGKQDVWSPEHFVQSHLWYLNSDLHVWSKVHLDRKLQNATVLSLLVLCIRHIPLHMSVAKNERAMALVGTTTDNHKANRHCIRPCGHHSVDEYQTER